MSNCFTHPPRAGVRALRCHGAGDRAGFWLLLVALLTLAGCAGGNRPLQLLSGSGPTYPAAAKAAGIEGEVRVIYDVTAEGNVTNLRVLSAAPPDVFDAAALEALRTWKYQAPSRAGVPQPVTGVTSTVRFRLGDGDEYQDFD